jgi:hypothetical protein
MFTIAITGLLLVGIANETKEVYSKANEIKTLKKQIKFREGQIELLLTAKSIAQQKQTINKCKCKALQTSKK